MVTKNAQTPDLYGLLGVERESTLPQIKTAYKKLALKWHPDKHTEAERETATEKFKEISGAYSILSNEEKREYYDRTGRIAENDDEMRDANDFMDDLMREFFGASGSFDDFDEFITVLEGGSDKAFRKMFKELGRQTRVRNVPKNPRKAALNKKAGGGKGSRGGIAQMEREMMEMMGLGGGPGSKKNKSKKGKKGGRKNRGDSSDYDSELEGLEEEMMAELLMGGGAGMPEELLEMLGGAGSAPGGKGKKGKGGGMPPGMGMSEDELMAMMMAEMMGGPPPNASKSKAKKKASEAKSKASKGKAAATEDGGDGDWETESEGEDLPEVTEEQAAKIDAAGEQQNDWETDSEDD